MLLLERISRSAITGWPQRRNGRVGFYAQAPIILRPIVLLLAVVAGPFPAGAQLLQESLLDGSTPPGIEAGSAAGSFALSGFDNVNLFDGKLNFSLPLLAVAGRGDAGYTISLKVENHWDVETQWYECHPSEPGCGFQFNARVNLNPELELTGWEPGYGPGIMTTRIGVLTTHSNSSSCISPPDYPDGRAVHWKKLTRFTFTRGDGSSLEFRDTKTDGAASVNTGLDCTNPPSASRDRIFRASDGSGATYVSDANVDDGSFQFETGGVIDSSITTLGAAGNLWFRDGTLYRIEGGLVRWMRDRNGNVVRFRYDGTGGQISEIYDSLERKIKICYSNESCPEDTSNTGPIPNVDRIVYKGFNGALRVIRVEFSNLEGALGSGFQIQTIEQLFPQIQRGGIQDSPQTQSFNPDRVVKAIKLPNARQYTLEYTSYRELHAVTLPTGGKIEYRYAPGPATTASGLYPPSQAQMVYRRATKRIVKPNGSTIEGSTTFSAASETGGGCIQPSPLNTPCTRVEVNHYAGDPDAGGTLLAHEKHKFYREPQESIFQGPEEYPGYQSSKEYRGQTANSAAATPLRDEETAWEQSGSVLWWTGDANDAPPKNPRRKWAKTILDGFLTSAEYFVYDSRQNVTERYEYDFGQFDPTDLPGTYKRLTKTVYNDQSNYVEPTPNPVTPFTEGAHLLSLVTNRQICNANGCASGKESETQLSYDQSGTTPASGVIGHDTSSFPAGSFTGVIKIPSDFPAGTARGNLTTEQRLISGTTFAQATATYQNTGNVLSLTDPRFNTTTATYDDDFLGPQPPDDTFAFATTITRPLGMTTTRQFDYNVGRVTTFTDENSIQTTFNYNDSLDRLKEVIQAANDTATKAKTTFAYDDHLAPAPKIRRTSDLNSFGDQLLGSNVIFDGLGRETTTQLRESAGSNNCTNVTKSYDGLGRVKQVTNPYRPAGSQSCNTTPTLTGALTTTAYDAAGRVTSLTHPDSSKIETKYRDNLTVVIDEAGKRRLSKTDALGRLLEVREHPACQSWEQNCATPPSPILDYLTTYTYDALDNLIQVNQGVQTRTYAYDALRRLVCASNPESRTPTPPPPPCSLSAPTTGVDRFTYDNNGNLLTKKDARGVTTTFAAYDALNRPTSKSYSDGTPPVTYFYHTTNPPGLFNKGRLFWVNNSEGTSFFYAYDALGRVTVSQQSYAALKYFNFSYTYRRNGELASLTLPSGRTLSYTHDDAGRITSMQSGANNYTSNYVYAPHGAVSEVRLGNVSSAKTQQSCFNNRLQAINVRLGTGMSSGCAVVGTDLLHLTLSYGATTNNGNLLSQTIQAPAHSFSRSQSYTYDGVNRLLSADESGFWTQSYSYDAFGNRRLTGAAFPIPSLASHFSSSTNRITLGSFVQYDNAGNLTRSVSNLETMSYDAENRMTEYNHSGAPGNNRTYGYDGEGRRVRKSLASGAIDTFYVYDAFGRLAAEYKTAFSLPVGIHFRTTDHLGSTRLVTDYGGAVCSRHDYYPFGEEIPTNVGSRPVGAGYGEPGLNQKFTGQFRDTESTLDYFGARYFSSPMGRFTSPDPIIEAKLAKPQTWNKYSYVSNDPLLYVDPNGEAESIGTFMIEKDTEALARGDITPQEFHERNRARAAGAAAGLLALGVAKLAVALPALARAALTFGLANPQATQEIAVTAAEVAAGVDGPSLTPAQVGAKRVAKVAEIVGGTALEAAGKQGMKIIGKLASASTDVDVLGSAGELIVVGGPAKAKSLADLGKRLTALKEVAGERGVKAVAFFTKGTPEKALELARKKLGKENVHLFEDVQ